MSPILRFVPSRHKVSVDEGNGISLFRRRIISVSSPGLTGGGRLRVAVADGGAYGGPAGTNCLDADTTSERARVKLCFCAMNAHILLAFLIAWFAVLSTAPALAQQPQRPPVRSITRIVGDLYRVQNNEHYTVFLVTPAGIILADPINVEAAAWIKAQLTERFPNAPVRHVLYSHHHQDHASGAAVFNDTAELVGHENFNRRAHSVGECERGGGQALRGGPPA